MRARTVEMRQLKKDLENQQLDERKEQLRLKAEEVRQAKERRRNPVKEEEPGRSSRVLRSRSSCAFRRRLKVEEPGRSSCVSRWSSQVGAAAS
jgi:hypothetical protein